MGRIAFVITGLGVGGAERQVIDLAHEYAARDHDVLVVTMIDPTDWGRERLGDAAALSSLSMVRGVPNPAGGRKLRSMLSAWEPDVVHAHMIHANLLTRAALMRTGVPLVNTIHNIKEGGSVLDRAQRMTKLIPAWTSVVSAAAFDRHLRDGLIEPSRSSVIHNGVRLPRSESVESTSWDPESGVTFRWLAIGRLEEQKDYPTMIRALATVRNRGHRAHLAIAGEGPEHATIEREIVALGLEDGVDLLGHVDSIDRLLDDHHALLSSSAWEGLPVTMLEAASRSRPIVATDVGGAGEIVNHGKSGFLTAADEASLADGMIKLMGLTQAGLSAMGADGFRHVKQTFDLNDITDTWLQLYGELT